MSFVIKAHSSLIIVGGGIIGAAVGYLMGMAFVNAAKTIGVKFKKNIEVGELMKNDEAITGIRTKTGVYDAEAVVLAAGVWSTYLASRIGAGISVAGGIGLGIAHLAAGRANPFDFSQYRVDRFGTFDPFSKEHLSRGAETRSKKVTG